VSGFKLFVLFMFMLGSAGVCATVLAQEDLSGSPPGLEYYSDYFSFAGRDEKGHVAFAIDNNRGRDGDEYQAEHFLVFHDELEGWRKLKGNGLYGNEAGILEGIPDSPHFRFSGTAAEGFTIHSETNGLKLITKAIGKRISRKGDEGVYVMGSDDAILELGNRTVKGRVIHEYLYRSGFNRLTRKSPTAFKDFHGIYLLVDGSGDLYFHHRKGTPTSISRNQDGFLFLDGANTVLPFEKVTPSGYRLGLGLYRWPTRWEGLVIIDGRPGTLSIRTSRSKRVKTWVIGGFVMSIVEGILKIDGKEYPLYGFAELII